MCERFECEIFLNRENWPFDSSLNERRARCVNDLSVKFSWIEKIGWIDDGDDCECINISKYIIFLIKFGLRSLDFNTVIMNDLIVNDSVI